MGNQENVSILEIIKRNLMTYFASKILRHQPPFLFIDAFNALDNGAAEASVQFFDPLSDFLLPLSFSILPVEFAAQLMGARFRLDRHDSVKSGFISKIKFFEWLREPEKIETVRVKQGPALGDFHEFSACFMNKSGDICAKLRATLYLSNKVEPSLEFSAVNERIDDCSQDHLFFEVNKEIKEGVGKVTLLLNENCSAYQGHFPNNPITPGVLLVEGMIDTAVKLIACNSTKKWQLANLQDVVFQSIVLPGKELVIKVKGIQNSSGRYDFTASIFNNGKRCTRGKFSLRSIQ